MEDLTQIEKSAIRALERLAKKWPKSLLLYSGNGSLFVMKKRDDGGWDRGYGKGVDPDCVVRNLGKKYQMMAETGDCGA